VILRIVRLDASEISPTMSRQLRASLAVSLSFLAGLFANEAVSTFQQRVEDARAQRTVQQPDLRPTVQDAQAAVSATPAVTLASSRLEMQN
jgi:hypothetical protein